MPETIVLNDIDPTWLKVATGLVLPLLTFLAGLFAQKIVDAIYHPDILLNFDSTSQDCMTDTDDKREHKNKRVRKHRAKYLRVKAVNLSSTTARGCRAYLVGIEVFKKGAFSKTTYCDTTPLSWACRQSRAIPESEFGGIDLPIGVNQFIDVVSIIDDRWKSVKGCNGPLEPKTRIRPFRYESLFNLAGTFRYTIMVAGDNFSPKKFSVVFKWDGPSSKYPYNFSAE